MITGYLDATCTWYYTKNVTCKSISHVKSLAYKHKSSNLHLAIHLSSQVQAEGSSDLIVLNF